ncbi:hypothetical protein [Sphingomonas sp.]|uniref:hypothetical protein n=1 Tax=Sphingomonas sp. TaxID=28214 RepID=UPI0035C7EE49
MLFTTTTQYIALVVALIAGWLFGLASHPGGKKWKQRYAEERNGHTETRRALEARVAELERDNARLASAIPVASAPDAASRAEPAYRDEDRRPL